MQIDLDGPCPEGDGSDDEDMAPELRLVPADASARTLLPQISVIFTRL